MKRFPQQNFNHGVHRERDTRALRRQLVMLVCGLAMAGGFVVAAGQHFAAVRYGYDGEKLRAERARLMEEQQQLILQINAATAPASLDRAAREIGMQPARPAQINRARGSVVGGGQAATATAATPAPKSSRTRSVAH
jgi:cell division protein FtsL